MECAWCTNCNADVASAHALSKLPCPQCSGTDYFIVSCNEDAELEAVDAKAESLMQRGKWDEAAAEYGSCSIMEPSELTLRMATLEWRKDCAQHIDALLSGSSNGMPVEAFRKDLLDNYDEYVTKWVMLEYRGICLIPNGPTYNVARRKV